MHAARGLISVILAKQRERALNPYRMLPSLFSSPRARRRGDRLQAASLCQHLGGPDLGPIMKPRDAPLQLQRCCGLVPHIYTHCTPGSCARGSCTWCFASLLGLSCHAVSCWSRGKASGCDRTGNIQHGGMKGSIEGKPQQACSGCSTAQSPAQRCGGDARLLCTDVLRSGWILPPSPRAPMSPSARAGTHPH